MPWATGCEGKNLQTLHVNIYNFIEYAKITNKIVHTYTHPCPSRYTNGLAALPCVSAITVSLDLGVGPPSEWVGCEYEIQCFNCSSHSN